MPKILRGLVAVSSVAVFVLALWVLHKALHEFSFADVQRALHRTPWGAIAVSLAATVGSYGVLTGFDTLAAR